MSGALGALGALAALLERRNSGEGQVLDVALYESVLAFMESLVSDYVHSGTVRERTGATLPGVAPSNVYPTRDGRDVLIAGNQDSVFRRLAEVMGAPELAQDLRYATHVARGLHQAELDDLVTAWTKTLDSHDVLDLLSTAGVPAGPIYRAPEMLADPHFAARGALVEVPHATLGSVTMQNVVPRASRTPGSVRWAGPPLGQHTRAVLHDMAGLTDAQIDAAQGGS
jgi:formyl-CoA transferase